MTKERCASSATRSGIIKANAGASAGVFGAGI